MTASVLTAALFAVAMGAGTFFSPCAYALLPGYVGYYVAETGEQAAPLSGALARGGAAASGVVVTLGGLSVLALSVGEWIERALPILEPLVGVALIVLGIAMLYGNGTVHVSLPKRRSSVLGFGLFGGLYAVAAAGCTLPLFTAVTLDAIVRPAGQAAVTLGTYVGTVALLMLAVTVVVGVGHELSTERFSPNPTWIARFAAIVLVAAGIGQLYVAFML